MKQPILWAWRAAYRRALRRLALRLRERQAERDKVGLGALEKQLEAVVDDMFALNRAITGLPDCTPDNIAANLMIELNWTASTHDNTGTNIDGIAGALHIMRPHLTGNIAADAADLLDNPDAPITERMAWIG